MTMSPTVQAVPGILLLHRVHSTSSFLILIYFINYFHASDSDKEGLLETLCRYNRIWSEMLQCIHISLTLLLIMAKHLQSRRGTESGNVFDIYRFFSVFPFRTFYLAYGSRLLISIMHFHLLVL